MDERHQIVIVGGGTAGVTVAARLRDADPALGVAVIEPSEKHYYQPLWTLVGGGIYPASESERDEAEVMPEGVTWLRDAVEAFDPGSDRLTTRGGRAVGYDFLIVAPGLEVFWDKVKGLDGSVGRDGICSNYDYRYVESTWRNIRDFQGGTAVFTQPSGAIKCGGAPQKIAYLAEDAFRRSGVRDRSRVVFATATPRIFAVDKYARALEGVIERKGIEALYKHELTEVRPASKEAVFRKLDAGADGGEVVIRYDMIHVTPPMGPPRFVADSPLADKEGWVDVDKHTLRHARYPNVFSLGDASSLPTSKTGAAVRKQAPVLVENLLAAMNGGAPTASYDGYTSCPLVTGYNTLILAEFDYDKNPAESFPFDQGKERYSMFLLKKLGLPAMYWHGMLRGRM
jgi:sulfide:quinone oxidoreductase